MKLNEKSCILDQDQYILIKRNIIFKIIWNKFWHLDIYLNQRLTVKEDEIDDNSFCLFVFWTWDKNFGRRNYKRYKRVRIQADKQAVEWIQEKKETISNSASKTRYQLISDNWYIRKGPNNGH